MEVEEEKMEVEEAEPIPEAIPEVDTIAEKGPPHLPARHRRGRAEETRRADGQEGRGRVRDRGAGQCSAVQCSAVQYVIVVQGVETGLCGKYWGDLDNMPSRRSRGKLEALQVSAVQCSAVQGR